MDVVVVGFVMSCQYFSFFLEELKTYILMCQNVVTYVATIRTKTVVSQI